MAIISRYTGVPALGALTAQAHALAWAQCIDGALASTIAAGGVWAKSEEGATANQATVGTNAMEQKKAGQLSLTIGPLKKLVAGTGFEPVTFGL